MTTLLRSLTILLVLAAAIPSQEAVSVNGRLLEVDGQRTLYLWGTPHERGFAHGYLLAEDIMASVNEDFAWLLKQLPGVGTALYSHVLLKTVVPNFAFDEDENEELKGLLAGVEARLTPEQRTVTALKRPITLEDFKAANTAGDWMALGCASFAASGKMTKSGAPAVARNFDFPALSAVLQRQFAVVVDPGQGRIPYVGVGHPGGIGILTGLSAEGVFVSIHDVRVKADFADARKKNTPRLLALRRILMTTPARGAVPAAFEKLKSWTTLYGNNILVATSDTSDGSPFAGVIEYDRREDVDEGATLRLSDPEETNGGLFLTCTNHHRARDGRYGVGARPCWRYERLCKAGTATTAPLEVADLFAIIDTSAFPRNQKAQVAMEHGTLHQAVALTGPRELHLRFGAVGEHISKRPARRLVLEQELEKLRGLPASK